MPHHIDLEWLQSATELILSGKYRHRREGKTTAYVMLMVGEVELGAEHNTYLYIGHNTELARAVAQQFAARIVQLYPSLEIRHVGPQKVKIGNQLYIFTSPAQLKNVPEMLHGITVDRLFYDIDDPMQYDLDEDPAWQEVIKTILSRLAVTKGDVI